MDTSYADAVNRLEDTVAQACDRALEHLTRKEVADELRRLAAAIETNQL